MPKNILLYALPAWGHLKPLIALIVLIAEQRPDARLTLPVCVLYPQVMAELEKIPKERLVKVQERIHIIQIPHPGFPATLMNNPDMNEALKKLYRLEEVTCMTSGNVVHWTQKPNLVILDFTAGSAYETIRSLEPNRTTPIIAWNTTMTGPIAGTFGPEELGGRGNISAKIQALVEEGVDPVDAGKQVLLSTKGNVVRIPGYPPLYDYEFYPQEVDLNLSVEIVRVGYTVINEADGIISTSARFLESETVDVVEGYYQGKYNLPSLAFISAAVNKETGKDETGALEFLDRILREVGKKSLIYISFGTHFWPPHPENLSVIIEELISSSTPFLLGRGSPLAVLPEETLKAVEAYDLGMVMNWTPQDAILQHPATGWFLTHGGWNSAQEAIRYRVPQIFWPIAADQPTISALMSIKHGAGFELISVRSGIGAKTPYRLREQTQEIQFAPAGVRKEFRELLVKLRGEEGRNARKEIEKLGDEADKLWVKGGEAEVGLKAFLVKFLGNGM